MSAWTGQGMRATFLDWKKIAKNKVKQRRKDARRAARADRLNYEQEMANMDFAHWNLSKWEKHWDDFNDLNYWVHSESGKSTYDEPTTELYVPKGWVQPPPPPGILASEGNPPPPRPHRRNEQDTASEASSASSASDSEEERWKAVGDAVSSDDDDGGDGDEEKKVDDAVEGMVPAEGEEAELNPLAIKVNTSGDVGFANEDEIKTILSDGTSSVTVRPSTSQEIAAVARRPGTSPEEEEDQLALALAKPRGKGEEIDLAMSRVLKKRRKQVKRRMQREGTLGPGGEEQSEIAKAIAKKEREDAEAKAPPTEEEVMIMVGFDPERADDYSRKEMDAFAKKAIAMNKKLGRTENGGVGSLEGPDGKSYGRYEESFVTGFFNKRKQKKELKEKMKEERAKKYGSPKGGKGGAKEEERDNSPTGLGTVFSRAGPRPKKK